MNRGIFLILLLIPLILSSSGLPVHTDIAGSLFNDIFDYYIAEGFISDELANQHRDEIEDYFFIGTKYPDIIRNEFLQIACIFDYNNGMPYIDVLECKDDVLDEPHVVSRAIIEEMFNNSNVLNEGYSKVEFTKRLFFYLGFFSHNLEDLYTDLFWQSYLSDSYGFGDFTDFRLLWEFSDEYRVYHAFNDLESYLDAFTFFDYQRNFNHDKSVGQNSPTPMWAAGDKMTNAEYRLFEDIFMAYSQDQIRTVVELISVLSEVFPPTSQPIALAYLIITLTDTWFSVQAKPMDEFWMNKSFVNYHNDVEWQYNALISIIDILKDKSDIHPNTIIITQYIENNEIPPIFFNDAGSDADFIEKGISCWSGQVNKGRWESVKKSLITEQCDPQNIGYNYWINNKYVSIPEIMIYDVWVERHYNDQDGNKIITILKPYKSPVWHYTFNTDYTELKFGFELFSPTTSTLSIKDSLLQKQVNVHNNTIDIAVDICGFNENGEELLIRRVKTVHLNELSLLHIISNNRLIVEGNIDLTQIDINNYYSIWGELSIKMNNGDYKCFYTTNVKDFYHNQIIDFEYKNIPGRRHKMQMVITPYPVSFLGYRWEGNENMKDMRLYTGIHALNNVDYYSNDACVVCYAPIGNHFYLTGKIDGISKSIEEDVLELVEDVWKPTVDNTIIIYNSNTHNFTEIEKDFNELLNEIQNFEENQEFIVFMSTRNLEIEKSKFFEFEESFSSNIRNLALTEIVDDKFKMHKFDEYCFWAYAGKKLSSEAEDLKIQKYQEELRRFGEGPIFLKLEDKSPPQVNFSEPKRNFITNEFDLNQEFLISLSVKDNSIIDQLHLNIVNEEGDTINGTYYIEITNSQGDKEWIEVSDKNLDLTINNTERDINAKLIFSEYPINEDRYSIQIRVNDHSVNENEGIYNHYFYIDRNPPFVEYNSTDEIFRLSTIATTEIYILLNISDNFAYLFGSLNQFSKKIKEHDTNSIIYSYEEEDKNYGNHLHEFDINENIPEGIYDVSVHVEDNANNSDSAIVRVIEIDNTPPDIQNVEGLPNEVLFSRTDQIYEVTFTTNEYTHGYIVFKNAIDSFAIYDEGNINDDDYVRGEIDNLSFTISSNDVSFYPEGHYTLSMVYEDELGNRAKYETRNVIIDRQYPRINQAIVQPFVTTNGNTVTLTCNINENQDTEENYGDIHYRIYKNEALLEEGTIEENENQQAYDVSDDDGNIEFDYEIPEDENARQSLRIEAEDESGNINTVNVAYIVNTLGVVITDPDNESTLGNGYYYIKGIASDPNITNSYDFDKYKIHYIANDVRYNNAIEVPVEHMGDSANISNNAVMYDDILTRINTTEMLIKSDDIKVIVTAYEDFTLDSLCDTVQIYIDGGSIVPNPIINQLSYINSNIEYEISGTPCEVDLTVVNSTGDVIYKFDADNYYYVRDEFSKMDDSKAYVYKNTSGYYVIESMSDCDNITFSLEEANLLSIEGQIRENEDKYTISGEGKMIFSPRSDNNWDGINDNPIELKSDYYSSFMFDENVSGRDAIMKLDGTISYKYNMVDMMGNDIDPGVYTVTLEVYGFGGGFDSREITFEKQSNLQVNISTDPPEINPYEPGFETSIINISGNESFYMDLEAITEDNEVIQVENNIIVNRGEVYSYEFDGTLNGDIKEGIWQIKVSYRNLYNEPGEAFAYVTVNTNSVNVIDGLYIQNNYIRGNLNNYDVINANPLYNFLIKPTGISMIPVPYEYNFYTTGRKWFDGVILSYDQLIKEKPKSELNDYIRLDQSKGAFATTDEFKKGVFFIQKESTRNIKIKYRFHSEQTNVGLYEYDGYLYFNYNGVSDTIAHWTDDNEESMSWDDSVIIDDPAEYLDIIANVDVGFNADMYIEVMVIFEDNIRDTIYLNQHNSCTNNESFILNGENYYDPTFDYSTSNITQLPVNCIYKMQYVDGNGDENIQDDYTAIEQPMEIRYLYDFTINGLNNSLEYEFPIYDNGEDKDLNTIIDNNSRFRINCTSNSCQIYNKDSNYNIIKRHDSYIDTINTYFDSKLYYEHDVMLLDAPILSLFSDDRILDNTIVLDSSTCSGNIFCDDEIILSNAITIFAADTLGLEWMYTDDKEYSYNKFVEGAYNNTDNEFPDKGIGKPNFFIDKYTINPKAFTFEIVTDALNLMKDTFNYFDEYTEFIPSDYTFNGIVKSDISTVQFSDLCTSNENNTIVMDHFDNTNDNSEVAFRISNSDGDKYFNCDAYYIQEPLITILINTSEVCMSSTFTLDNEEQTSIAVDESVLQGNENNLIVNFSIYRPSGEMLYTINEEFEYSDFNEGRISKHYTFEGDDYLVRYEVAGNYLNIQYFSVSGNYIDGNAVWSVDSENEYNIDDNLTLPNNYNSIEINYSLNSQDYDKVVDYFGAIQENPLFTDNSGQIKEVSTFVRHIQNGVNPNEYVIGLEKDNHYDVVSVAPVATPYEYEIVMNGVYENYTITGNYKFNDTLGIDLGYGLSYGSVIKINMNYEGYDYLHLSLPTYDYPYRDSIIYIKHTNTNNNDSLWFIFEQDPKALFYTHSDSYRSNPYLNISNWSTELYYPNGDINMDLIPVDSISNAYNMNTQDYFSPKLQLRAKPKGFVPINLDVSSLWSENELDDKYFRMYFRNEDGVIEITDGYTPITQLDGTAHYFECSEYYGDGKLICKLYEYDSNIIPIDNRGPDEDYNYLGIMFKDIKIGDIIADSRPYNNIGLDDWFTENSVTMTPYNRTQAYFNDEFINSLNYPILSKVHTVYPNQAVLDNASEPYLGGYKCPIIALYPKELVFEDLEHPQIKYYITAEETLKLGISKEDVDRQSIQIYKITEDGDLVGLFTSSDIDPESKDFTITIWWDAYSSSEIISDATYFTLLRKDETDTEKPYDIEIVSKTKDGIRIKGKKDSPGETVGFMITDPMESIYEALYWYNERKELTQRNKAINIFDEAIYPDGIDDTLIVYRFTAYINDNCEFDVVIPIDSLFEGHNRIFIGNADAFEFAVYNIERRIKDFEPLTIDSMSGTYSNSVKNCPTEILDLTYTKTPPEIVFTQGYTLPANINNTSDIDTIKFTTTRRANIGLFMYDINGNEIVSKVYQVDENLNEQTYIWNGWINGKPAPCGEYQTVLVAYDENGYVSDQESGYFVIQRGVDVSIVSPVDNDWIAGNQTLEAEIENGEPCLIDWTIEKDNTIFQRYDSIPSYNSKLIYSSVYDDGIYQISADAYNNFGDTGEDDITMKLDNTAPSINFISNPDLYVNGCNVYYRFNNITAQFEITDTFSLIDRIEYYTGEYSYTNDINIDNYILDIPSNQYHGEYVQVFAYDNCNNESGSAEYLFEPDNELPELSLTIGNPKVENNGNIYIADYTPIWINASDELSGIKEIEYGLFNEELERIEWHQYTGNMIYLDYNDNNRETLFYQTYDNVGNHTYKSQVLNFDMTPPVSQLIYSNPSYVSGDNIYLSGSSTITVSATDDMSGVQSITYILEGNEYTQIGNTVDINLTGISEGSHILTYYATDKAGNIEEQKEFIFILDNTPPVLSIAYNMPEYYGTHQFVTSQSSIDIFAEDISCGVKEVNYDINGIITGTGTGPLTVSLISLDENVYNIMVNAYDNLDNYDELNEEFVVDNSSPVSQITIGLPQYIKGDTTLITSNTPIDLISQDKPYNIPSSGVREINYGYNGINNTVSSSEHTDYINDNDGAYEYNYFAIDNLGNIEQTNTITVELDNTAPDVVISYPYDGIFINQDIDIKGYAEDKNWSRWKLEYKNTDDLTWHIITDWQTTVPTDSILGTLNASTLENGVYAIRLTAEDLVNNVNTCEITVKIGEPNQDLELTGYLKPEGVWGGDYIYIADTQHKRAVKVDEDNTLLLEIKEFQPSDVFVDNRGRIFITDQDSKVYIYTAQGDEIKVIDGHLHPKGIEVWNNKIYVADTYKNRIVIYSINGDILQTIPVNKHPEGIAVDEYGNIFTCIDESNEIRGYNSSGEEIFRYGVVGHGVGEFVRAVDIDVDSRGYLWVCDRNNNRVHMIDWRNELDLFILGERGQEERHKDGMNKPEGLSIVEENGEVKYIYIADTNNDRILRYNLSEISTDNKVKFASLQNGGLEIEQFLPYPNPTDDVSTIRVVLSQPAELTINVFTLTGKLVYNYNITGTSGINEVIWTGINTEGIDVLNGVYNIQVIATSGTSSIERWSKIAIIR